MIQTQGLTHIHIAVRDLQRSAAFYRDVFGMEVMERGEPTLVFMRTPGAVDTLTLRLASPDEPVGQVGGGVDHFGFRLKDRATSTRRLRLSWRQAARWLNAGSICLALASPTSRTSTAT